MSESGFDVLKGFQPEGGSITYEPYTPIVPQNTPIEYQQERAEKDQISIDQAARIQQDTNLFNYYANQYAGQMLPVIDAANLNMANYAEMLGLGQRYSPDDFKKIIEESIGPIEEDSKGRQLTRFITDAFNARTPYKGVAGALDIYLQTTGKRLEREDQIKAAKLERRLMVGELAAKQAADANENIKAVEADFYLKKMGYDNANAEKYLGFTSDILKKIAQTNLDMEEEKLKASMHFLKNPQQPVQVAYTGPDGKVVGPIAAMPIQTETGIQYRLGRVTEDGQQIFDVKIPGDEQGRFNLFFPSKTAAAEDVGNFKNLNLSQSKVREGSSNLFTLQNQYNDVMSILDVAKADPSKVGVSGSIKKAIQEVGATTEAVFNLLGNEAGVGGAYGTGLVDEGQMLFSFDQANPGAIPTGGTVDTSIKDDIVLTDVPTKVGGLNVPFKKQTKVVQASLNDIVQTSWWEGQGYDPTYAQNKVKEIFIIYGLARALKSTGRLNVDDIQRASEAVSIYGLQSPEQAIAKLEQVALKLSDAQKAIIRSTPEVLGTTPEVNEVIIPLLERLNLPVDPYRQYFMDPSASGAVTATQPEGTFPTTINEAAEQSITAAPEGSTSLKVEDLFSTL
jgi:hypothetical protein